MITFGTSEIHKVFFLFRWYSTNRINEFFSQSLPFFTIFHLKWIIHYLFLVWFRSILKISGHMKLQWISCQWSIPLVVQFFFLFISNILYGDFSDFADGEWTATKERPMKGMQPFHTLYYIKTYNIVLSKYDRIAFLFIYWITIHFQCFFFLSRQKRMERWNDSSCLVCIIQFNNCRMEKKKKTKKKINLMCTTERLPVRDIVINILSKNYIFFVFLSNSICVCLAM